jgi:hypothetical protein
MTEGWINALLWILYAAALGAVTAWLHSRIKHNEDQFLSLVDALNSQGAGLHHTGAGYVSALRPQPDRTEPLFQPAHPLAANPGPAPMLSPTMRGVPERHALRDPLLSQPPYTGPEVRDWLLHHTHRTDVTWPGVIKEFYDAAGQDDEVKVYFANTEMAVLKRHFADTMLIITREGVSESLLQAMKHAHHHITDPNGNPLRITGHIYDKVISVLVGVLQRNGVPQRAIDELAKTIEPLRDAIVCDAQ